MKSFGLGSLFPFPDQAFLRQKMPRAGGGSSGGREEVERALAWEQWRRNSYQFASSVILDTLCFLRLLHSFFEKTSGSILDKGMQR